jgi:ribosomal protein L22
MEKAESAARKAREDLKIQEQKARQNIKMGGLAQNSVFAEPVKKITKVESGTDPKEDEELSGRSFSAMARVLNPNPDNRARWHRTQIIRHIRRGGRLTKEMKIARTERMHLAKSHFYRTSMKKLAPLARQIAGKPIDAAILQMRFSKKKVAQDVQKHLIHARNEAIAMRGMGLRSTSSLEQTLASSPVALDPSITPHSPEQNATKKLKKGFEPHETDIYVSEAWTNTGRYGKLPDYRARGQLYIMRPPTTGLTVVLKEEKTRKRLKMEKEIKAVKKRLGKTSWTQLPDRKITNQSQYLLW